MKSTWKISLECHLNDKLASWAADLLYHIVYESIHCPVMMNLDLVTYVMVGCIFGNFKVKSQISEERSREVGYKLSISTASSFVIHFEHWEWIAKNVGGGGSYYACPVSWNWLVSVCLVDKQSWAAWEQVILVNVNKLPVLLYWPSTTCQHCLQQGFTLPLAIGHSPITFRNVRYTQCVSGHFSAKWPIAFYLL